MVQRICLGNVNCYIISGEKGAILVDTGRETSRQMVLEACRPYNVRLIVLTHGHVDHVQNAPFLSEALSCPVAMSGADIPLLRDNMLQPLSARSLLGKLVLGASIKSFHKDKIPPFVPYHDRTAMLQSAARISGMGARRIYFGHGRSIRNREWLGHEIHRSSAI